MSTFSQQALRVGRSLLSWSNRLVKFAKHRVLTKRKSALIIGAENSLLYSNLHPLLAKGWSIIHIQTASKPQISQIKIQQQSSNTNDKDIEIVKQQSNNSKPTFFKRLYLSENYDEIQKSLQGNQFDSVIVLPEKPTSLNIADPAILSDYPQNHINALMRQAFSYRLASKYLTTSGVVILSMSEQDFIQDSVSNPIKNIEIESDNDNDKNIIQQRLISDFIIDSQINYLGVVLGDRDYTDLNSWSIVALSNQRSQREQDGLFVAKMYSKWADSQQLPMPGSFALFKKDQHKNKTHYVQYL